MLFMCYGRFLLAVGENLACKTIVLTAEKVRTAAKRILRRVRKKLEGIYHQIYTRYSSRHHLQELDTARKEKNKRK